MSTVIKFTYKNEITDSIKFKREYEGLNKEYLNIKINKNNSIKYSTYDEIFNVLENGTGIILGSSSSNWSRSVIPVLLEVANDNKISTIYYLDITDDMDNYIVEDEQLVYMIDDNGNEQRGTDDYFKLLDKLDEYLSDYIIQIEDNIYEVGEKRIFLPTVIFVRNGSIIGLHISSVASHTDSNKKLNNKQYSELYDIYEGYIFDMTSETCSTDKKDSGC